MGIEACNAVLAGDLFNKITNKVSEKESYVATRAFFTMTEREAFTNYKKFAKSNTGGGGEINGNFFVKLMPVGVRIAGGGFREFTEGEFRQEFSKWKTLISEQINNQGEFSIESYFNSFVRDENSIQAWRDCVIAAFEDDDGGLLAFGSRDDSNNPVLEIEWRISLELAQNRSFLNIATKDGVAIKGFTQRSEIAGKSNKIFLLDLKGITDEEKSKGFTIVVTVDVIDKDDENLNEAVPIVTVATTAVIPPVTIPSGFIEPATLESVIRRAPTIAELDAIFPGNIDVAATRWAQQQGFVAGIWDHEINATNVGVICLSSKFAERFAPTIAELEAIVPKNIDVAATRWAQQQGFVAGVWDHEINATNVGVIAIKVADRFNPKIAELEAIVPGNIDVAATRWAQQQGFVAGVWDHENDGTRVGVICFS
jgi:hypothetical protein